VTLWDLSRTKVFANITLIKYPPFKSSVFDLSIESIRQRTGQEIAMIELNRSPFSMFTGSHHFPDVVFVKLLVPHLLKNRLVVYIDGGYLIRNHIGFAMWMRASIEKLLMIDRPLAMPRALPNENEQTGIYKVAAGIMLFDTRKYLASGFSVRLLNTFFIACHTGKLQMPEQNLIELTLSPDEILILDDTPQLLSDLCEWSKLKDVGIHNVYDLPLDIALFKFVGSFKPWHYWVLNPDKSLFLHRVMEASVALGIPLIYEKGFFAQFPAKSKESWATGQLFLHNQMLAQESMAAPRKVRGKIEFS